MPNDELPMDEAALIRHLNELDERRKTLVDRVSIHQIDVARDAAAAQIERVRILRAIREREAKRVRRAPRLSKEKVRGILEAIAKGESAAEIAQRDQIAYRRVRDVSNGRIYRNGGGQV